MNETQLGSPWFKPRRFGYGFTPISSAGVAASVIVFLVLGLCIGLPAMLLGLSLLAVILSTVGFVAVLAVFILVAHRHTDYSL